MRKSKNSCRLVDAFRIYPASNLRHRELWKSKLAQGHPIHATWLDKEKVRTEKEVTPETKAAIARNSGALWKVLIADVIRADGVLFYQEPGDINGGALIEVGAALAFGLPVFYVGDRYGEKGMSFLNHPLVERFFTLEEALEAISQHGHKKMQDEGRHITTKVAGAPFELGSHVRVLRVVDRTIRDSKSLIGKVGTVVGYNYGAVGQHFPDDPLTVVHFGNKIEVFWKEELEVYVSMSMGAKVDIPTCETCLSAFSLVEGSRDTWTPECDCNDCTKEGSDWTIMK